MKSKTSNKRFFETRKLVTLALFVAISYVLSLLSFSIFPSAEFFKLDFGNIFILLPALVFGPIEGIIVCFIKEMLSLINTSSGGVGELANFLMTSAYILVPSIVYKRHKGIKPVIISLSIACLLGTVSALIVNRFIIFPLFMGSAAPMMFKKLFWIALSFNLIKTVSISIISFLMYKRLSGFLKRISVK